MKVLITGDSHTAALKMGLEQLKSDGAWSEEIDLTVKPLGNGRFFPSNFFKDRGDHAEMTEKSYRKQFARLPVEDNGEATIYGFCGALHTNRLWRDSDWEYFSPLAIASAETPVSASLLRRAILDDQRYVLSLLDLLRRAGKQVFVIEAPLPFGHNPNFNKLRPEVIRYVDREYRKLMKAELEVRGVLVVSVPETCVNDDGLMLSEYRCERERDVSHGNKQFGAVMMKQVLLRLDSAEFSTSIPVGESSSVQPGG